MLEMIVDSIRVSLTNYQRVVILKVKDTDKYLPIWIGPAEADAIALKLQDVSVPRPLTHDLLGSVIDSLGAKVEKIVVSELTDDTFFAKIVIQANGSSMEVDSRPSDAIALAVRTKAPIFADNAVVEQAGVNMDMETGKAVLPGEPAGAVEAPPEPVGEDELKGMSAFQDFIGTLDLEDLGGNETGSGDSAKP